MKISSAQANRLGNREANQDRQNIFEAKDSVLLVVADGMGGHAGGELAAEITVQTLEKHFQSTAKPVSNPRAFLGLAIESAHNNIVRAGSEKNIDPRTTCIACLIQNHKVYWGNVGDSRFYLIRENKVVTRTLDDSYVEELHKKGEITEKQMLTHPMRNYLTRCLGGNRGIPKITCGEHELQSQDVLLLCSDGFWSQLDENQLISISAASDIDIRLNELAGIAEQQYYPQSDNISALAVRWFESNSAISSNKQQKTKATKTGPKPAYEDPTVNDAVDAITNALEQYKDELKP